MIYGTNKLKKKIFLIITIVIIALIIIVLCVQSILKNNLTDKSIIAGKDVAKNEITQTLDEIDWIQDVDSSIGSITIEDNGQTVEMTGNRSLPGKNAIYYIPESHQVQTFGFDFDLNFGDSFNAAGVLLRVKKETNQIGYGSTSLHGYMLSFNNAGDFMAMTNAAITIWEFTYELNTNTNSQIQTIPIKSLGGELPMTRNQNVSGNLTIESTISEIVITGTVIDVNGNEIIINETIDISSDDDLGDGFGFFSSHYSHSCPDIGHFSLENFALTTIDIDPHNLYIDPNGGTWNGSSDVSSIEGVYEDEVEIPLPTRPGYNFAGWTQTGNSGTMSSLTEDAIYTFGEDAETDDTITAQWTKIDVSKEQRIDFGEDYGDIMPENPSAGEITYVIEDQQIIYTLTATNTGTVDGTTLIKDTVPDGTTFVENSIKINDEETTYTEEDLLNGISVPVAKDGSSTLSFKVKIKELEKGEIIDNKATYKDITISKETEEKETNNVQLIYFNTYGEPILSYSKSMLTEKGENYVTSGEKITYKINISNIGLVPLELTVKDQIPVGTTYVEDSLKVNNATYTKEDGSNATISDLENGLTVSVPAETTNYTISFEVTVNEELEDETEISNTATINGNATNTTTIKYGGSSITADKIAETQFKKNYVVYGERITYSIIIKNAGSIEKKVILKDVLPEEITLVDGSIKLDEKALKNEQGLLLSAEDLAKGISILVPRKAVGSNKPGETILSFIVTVNDLEDGDKITNIATVDDIQTNEVTYNYVENRLEDEGKITQTKEIETENGKDYVVEGEKIKITIKIENDGTTPKDVEVKDTIPDGTTFIDGSIKIDGDVAVDDNGNPITEETLENGIIVNVSDETTISYEVIVNKLENGDIIEIEPATIDDDTTNEFTIKYSETDQNPDNNPDDNPNDNSDDNSNNNQNNNSNNNQNNPNSNNNSNTNTGNNSNNTNNSGNNTTGKGEDTTTAQEDIPKTGFRNIILIIIIVIALGTVIFYIRYKKLNSYVK